jgi:hypothetical protein
MSEQRFPVAPGRVTALTGALAAGSTIINTDPANAVWVGGSPDVAPGAGVRLGPKGSMSWTTDGAPAYACADTGVTATVSLTVTGDMADLVNPVDVGVAVATQLLAQGIPSVFLGDTLTAQSAGVYDAAGHASLSVSVTFLGPCLFTYYYTTDDPAVILGSRSVSIAAGGTSIRFTSPVAGPVFRITDGGAGVLSNRTVYASNRALPDKLTNTATTFNTGATQAWTSGTLAALPGAMSTNGGPHRLRFSTTGTSAGYLTATVWDTNTGAMTDLILADTGNAHTAPAGATVKELQDTVYLPPGIVTFKFLPYTTATYQVIAHLVPVS